MKRTENIPKKKLDSVKELVNLIKTKKTILITDISNIPGSQFQSISKKIRNIAIVKVPKKNLFFRAIDLSKNEKLQELKNPFKGAVAILFSDLDSYELAAELLKNKSPSKAKPGQIAKADLEIPAGPTDLTPGPAISELGALGIQIMISGGKIEIKEPKIVAKEGEAIKSKVCDVLSKLNIQPFSIGFTPLSAYDSKENLIYIDININPEEARKELVLFNSKALGLALSLGIFNSETIKLMISKAGMYEKKLLKIIAGESDESETVNGINSPQEDKKEEEKVDATVGLASLFG